MRKDQKEMLIALGAALIGVLGYMIYKKMEEKEKVKEGFEFKASFGSITGLIMAIVLLLGGLVILVMGGFTVASGESAGFGIIVMGLCALIGGGMVLNNVLL